jgi:cell division protein FtsL
MNYALFADTGFFRSQTRRTIRRTALQVVATIFFVVSLLFMTFVHMGTLITGYSVADLEQRQDQMLRELQAMKLEEAVLKRPERIRKIAQEKLDLIPASKAPVMRL